MKQRLLILFGSLVFMVSMFVGIFPQTADAIAGSWYYTSSDYKAIQGTNPYALPNGHPEVTYREEKSKIGQGVYVDTGSGFGVGGTTCYPAIQTDSKKYDGSNKAVVFEQCAKDKYHPLGKKHSIYVAGPSGHTTGGTASPNQRNIFDNEICPGLQTLNTSLFLKYCNDKSYSTDQAKMDAAVKQICAKYTATYPDGLQAQCADYNNKTYNPTNTPGNGTSSANSCESSGNGFSLNWALCEVYRGVQAVVNWMFSAVISPLLTTTPICLPGNSCGDDHNL